jgi:cytoskeleton protein RodZ
MSGVAKDDTNPSVPDETVPAVGDAEAGRDEIPQTDDLGADSESRRRAPHLRVVSDNDDAVFVSPPASPASVTAGIDIPGQRIGAVFRVTRENLGYSLEQVSKETRVHLSHLRAIEDMTPNMLGAPVYAKGYIRAYARHLGLDENATLERYLRECAILKDPEKQSIAPPSTGRNLPVAVPVFGFLIVALAGAAIAFLFMNGNEQPAPTVTASTATDGPVIAPPQPSITPSSSAVATPSTSQQLRIVAVKRALIEVRSAAGDKYVRRYFEPGESYPVRVGYGWTVTAPEDGSAFEWRLGEQSLGLMQPEGGPAYSHSVDLAAKRPPVEAPAPVVEEGVTASTDAAIAPPGTEPVAPPTGAAPTAQRPSTASTAPSGPPGSRVATPPAASATPPKPRPPAQPRPRPETQAPAVAANSAPAQLPAAPPATPAQDPALLAYPNQ